MSALSKHTECNKGGPKLRSAFKGIPFNFEHMNLMSKSLQNITTDKTTDKEPVRVTDTRSGGVIVIKVLIVRSRSWSCQWTEELYLQLVQFQQVWVHHCLSADCTEETPLLGAPFRQQTIRALWQRQTERVRAAQMGILKLLAQTVCHTHAEQRNLMASNESFSQKCICCGTTTTHMFKSDMPSYRHTKM